MRNIHVAMAVVMSGLAATSGLAQTRPARAASAPLAPDANGRTVSQSGISAYDRAPWWMANPVITQTGLVFTEMSANRASFSASFQTTDDSADKAQDKAITQTRALTQALGKLGKDAVRVTTSFSMRTLYEQYRDKNGNKVEDQRGDKINGYQVSLNLNVEVRDVAKLEQAYALVLAASPDSTSQINFSLQPDNATNTWLYNEAIKDAHTRAAQAVAAAGAKLDAVKVIDPTGRACETDILARQQAYGDDEQAQYVQPRETPPTDIAPPPPIPVPPVPTERHVPYASVEGLQAKALQNPFIQTPPLQRIEAKACVVYGLN